MLHVPTAPFHRWSTCPQRLFYLPESCLETLATQSGPLFLKTAICLQAPQKHNANKSRLDAGDWCVLQKQSKIWSGTDFALVDLTVCGRSSSSVSGDYLSYHTPTDTQWVTCTWKTNTFFTQQLLPKSPRVWAAAVSVEEKKEGRMKTRG